MERELVMEESTVEMELGLDEIELTVQSERGMEELTAEKTFENEHLEEKTLHDKGNEGETVKISNDEADPIPSSSKAASSNDHVFAVPEAPSSKGKLNLGISENINDHIPSCSFVRWNGPHRSSLITGMEFNRYLFDFTVRITGKNKAAPIMNELECKVAGKVEGPMIQKYLRGSYSTYDKFRSVMLSKCVCPSARLPESSKQDNSRPSNLQVAAMSTFAASSKSPSILDYDLNLSSDSDSD